MIFANNKNKFIIEFMKLIILLISVFSVCSSSSSANNNAIDADTSKIIFKGVDQKVAYETGRKIGEVSYSIKNNSNEELTLKLVGAFLIRGNNADPLEGGTIKIYAKNKYRKQKILVIKPKRSVQFKVFFEPFELFTGSNYSVRTILEVDGKRIRAESKIELYKEARNDKNRIKEKN